MNLSRRGFLTYLGLGSYAVLCRPDASGPAAPPRRRARPPQFFDPILPSTDDQLVLPAGYRYDLICAWGDELYSEFPSQVPDRRGQKETFGYNCDFLAYFPMDARAGGSNSRDGLLWVNHEYPDPVFVSRYTWEDYDAAETEPARRKTAAQILDEKLSVGGSVIHVRRHQRYGWRMEPDPSTRRLTALYPEMDVSGPARDLILQDPADAARRIKCFGTLANCSGGRTPWMTALSCEENYPDYNEDRPRRLGRFGYRWKDQDGQGINEEHFGWIVEIDPYNPSQMPVKHTALGRFKHENAALRWNGPNRRLVVYMGDDERDQFLYKFVSEGAYEPPIDGRFSDDFRRQCSRLLHRGTLLAADFEHGRWLPLDLDDPVSGPRLRQTQVMHRGQSVRLDRMDLVLLYARDAARALGATPLDRPEDCEVHPRDGSLYLALTNNTRRANFHGQIVRLIEHNDDPEGRQFRFEIFLAGGRESGLACPDNLAFDREGNLWVACDISDERIGRGPYQPFGNNGLFVVPTLGRAAGDAYQFASGPIGSELTGPWFTDDGETLFLAVQHPGEGSPRLDRPISRWPHERKDGPRPSVVAITGFRGNAGG
jgi:hypothetical protein